MIIFSARSKKYVWKKSRLKIAQEETEEAIQKTNLKIDQLGIYTKQIYDALKHMQEQFDAIRNIPSDNKLDYQSLKEIRLDWKSQVNKIEEDYQKAATKQANAGAVGTALGTGVVALGPTAAMGVATTFGIASTGTAISTLSGATATNAALAWLGGGALVAGGGGIVAGNAFLALAGPVGWTIAAIALLSSGFLLFKDKKEKSRLEDLFILISKRDVTSYELAIVELNERIDRIVEETILLKNASNEVDTFGLDYTKMLKKQQYALGAYVNLMYSSTQLLTNPIIGLMPKYDENDLTQFLLNNKKNWSRGQKQFVINLCNLLYNIDIEGKDEKLLLKLLKGNKKYLDSLELLKQDVDDTLIEDGRKALEKKYEREPLSKNL